MRWRKFLQTPKSEVDSYVVVQVWDDDQSMMLKVADCDRRVQLWFPWRTKRQIAVSRKKVAILQEALDRLTQALDIIEEERNA